MKKSFVAFFKLIQKFEFHLDNYRLIYFIYSLLFVLFGGFRRPSVGSDGRFLLLLPAMHQV